MLGSTLSKHYACHHVHTFSATAPAPLRRTQMRRRLRSNTRRASSAEDNKASSSPSVTSTAADEEVVGLGLGPMKEKSTLISDNWVGDQYQGSGFNILTLILGLTFAVPVIGLAFAYLSYGNLWTGQWGVIPY